MQDDEFGDMDVDRYGSLIPDSVIRREIYLANKKMKRGAQITAWARRHGFNSKTGRRVEPRYVGGHVVYNSVPPSVAVPDQYDGVPHDPVDTVNPSSPGNDPEDGFVPPRDPVDEVDDYVRLKNNQLAGKYVGKFKPLGKSAPKPYKFDEL